MSRKAQHCRLERTDNFKIRKILVDVTFVALYVSRLWQTVPEDKYQWSFTESGQ